MTPKITEYHNFLSDSTYNEISEHISKITNRDNQTTYMVSNLRWEDNIVNKSAPVLIYPFNYDTIPFFKQLCKEIESKIPYVVSSIAFYTWTNLSYIPWHSDRAYKAALTIYLNKNWDENWGGIFLYKQNNEIKGIIPEKNKAILQEGSLQHSVSMITPDSDYRYTLQLFFKQTEKTVI